MQNHHRHLAAILFTDIVGYTSMMQENEKAAVGVIKHYNAVLEKSVAEHNGEIVNNYGDGSLCIFPSASEAVDCALEMQGQLQSDPRVPLRIGLHIGEIFFEDGKALGDGVNIASRIQSLGGGNTILISKDIFDKIRNHPEFKTVSLGRFDFKNVDEPMEVFALANEGLQVPKPQDLTGKLKPAAKENKSRNGPRRKMPVLISLVAIVILAAAYLVYNNIQNKRNKIEQANGGEAQTRSIAVLPFEDNSPGKDQGYLSEGIAEELLNVLSQIKGLKVKGRSSSFSFKGKETDLRKIGEILGVKSILKGSIQKFGTQIRIYTQLINADDEYLVWSERYERELKNIYSIQDEIASKISEKLKLTLLDKQDIPESRIVNPEAYETVLRGNLFFNKGDFGKAIDYYNKAIGIDSAYAYPYIRLGWAIYQRTLYNVYTSREGFPKARSAIEKGLGLNPTAAERQSAHHALAYINLWQYNWENAWTEYEEVIKIDPEPGTVYAYYQAFVRGKTSEAVTVIKKVLDENPFDIITLKDYAIIQYLDRKFDDALLTCDKIIDLDSSFSEAFRLKGTIYSLTKKFDLAMYNYKKAYEKGNDWAGVLMITTLSAIGQKEKARKLFLMMDNPQSPRIPSIAKGLIHFSLGEHDKAFEWLNRSYDERDFYLVSLKVEPLWDPLRSDPRFQKLVRKMNFPE
jgi:adenylate cyclase